DGDDASAKHAKTIGFVLRGHEPNTRLRISNRECVQRLTESSLAPIAGVAVKVFRRVSIAARNEGAVVKRFPLRRRERSRAWHDDQEAAWNGKADRAQLRPAFRRETAFLHVAQKPTQEG